MEDTDDEEIAMPYANCPPKEVASRGEAIYEQRIRHEVETRHKGEFLVVDIETGEYEVDADDLIATRRLLARHPDAIVYGLRIGFPTAYRVGASFPAEAR